MKGGIASSFPFWEWTCLLAIKNSWQFRAFFHALCQLFSVLDADGLEPGIETHFWFEITAIYLRFQRWISPCRNQKQPADPILCR